MKAYCFSECALWGCQGRCLLHVPQKRLASEHLQLLLVAFGQLELIHANKCQSYSCCGVAIVQDLILLGKRLQLHNTVILLRCSYG